MALTCTLHRSAPARRYSSFMVFHSSGTPGVTSSSSSPPKTSEPLAPDLRGFGDTDAPPSPSSYTFLHFIGDLIGLLDHLGLEKVFLVGHDWGAMIAWYFCLFRPDRVKALVNLSVYYIKRHPSISFVDGFRAVAGDNFYICQFQVRKILFIV